MKKILIFIGIFLLVASIFLIISNREGSIDSKDISQQSSNMDYLKKIREKDSVVEKDNLVKEFKSKDKEITIKNHSEILIDIKLDSPYKVSGLIASSDTKVAEFTLKDWISGRNKMFDSIKSFNLKSNYKEENRNYWFKYGVEKEICTSNGCFDSIDWTRFDSLNELPNKNVRIGMFTSTKAGEHIEWTPTINGFDILEFAEYDVSTASLAGNRSFTGNETDLQGFTFGNSGGYVYIVGATNDTIYQFTLTTPYNITTAVDTGKWLWVGDVDTSPRGLEFKTDGTKMYLLGDTGNDINQYTLSTPWDISTGTADSVTLSVLAGSDRGIKFNSGGKILWTIGGSGNDMIIQYNCTTAWDLSTCTQKADNLSLDGVFDSTSDSNIFGLEVEPEFINLYITTFGATNSTISQMSMSSTGNISTATYNGVYYEVSSDASIFPSELRFNNNGTRVYVSDIYSDAIIQYTIEPEIVPTIYLNTPLNNTNTLNTSITFNCSANDATELHNVSLIINESVFHTESNTGVNNISLEQTLSLGFGIFNWTCNSTSATNMVSTGGMNLLNISSYIQNLMNYNSETTSGSKEDFSLNISYNTATYPNIQASLYYNNTKYAGTKYGSGENLMFNKSLIVSVVDAKTNVSLYWTIGLNNGTDWNYFNSTKANQTVNPFKIDGCSVNSIVLYNFTNKDEKTKVVLGATTKNTTANLDLTVYSSDRGTLIANFSQNYTKINSFSVCINKSFSGNEAYSGDLEILYTADGYSEEYYHIQNGTIDSSHINQNISLYNLDNASTQKFIITYKDDNLLPVSDALIQVKRKYIEDGVLRVVEIPKTDFNGETLANLELNDVIYTLVVTKNGEILATFNEMEAICQTPLISDCRISLNSFSTSVEPMDFTNLKDFSFIPSYNQSSRTFKVEYTVPSGTSSTVLINATKFDSLGTTEICSDSLTSSSGTLTCTSPVSFGNGTAIFKVYKDGTLISSSTIALKSSPSGTYGFNFILLTIFLYLTLFGVGISSEPHTTGIFIIIGAIFAVALNLVGTGTSSFIGYGATILWIIIAIIIIMIKGANR